jgi:hypothetical protein
MYGITAEKVNTDVLRYVSQDAVKTSVFDKKTKCYTYVDKKNVVTRCKGLTKYLKKHFYPHFKTPRRKFGNSIKYQKLPSTKALGKRVDRELLKIIIAGNKMPSGRKRYSLPKNLHPLTQCICDFWKYQGMRPVAAQLPTQIPTLGVMTQCDIIVEDAQRNLYMHEIKTGYVGLHVHKGYFKKPYHTIKCSKAAVWDLQRHWTEKALKEQGLPLTGSNVIHAYMKRDTKTKQVYPVVKIKPKIFV